MNQASQILAEVKKAVCGKDRVLVWVLTVILARGHVLLEDIPGVGKTTMALAFSRALGLDYGRVQFTPDVLPSDITGYSIFDKGNRRDALPAGRHSLQPLSQTSSTAQHPARNRRFLRRWRRDRSRSMA